MVQRKTWKCHVSFALYFVAAKAPAVKAMSSLLFTALLSSSRLLVLENLNVSAESNSMRAHIEIMIGNHFTAMLFESKVSEAYSAKQLRRDEMMQFPSLKGNLTLLSSS